MVVVLCYQRIVQYFYRVQGFSSCPVFDLVAAAGTRGRDDDILTL
jgi:hypothetical protein